MKKGPKLLIICLLAMHSYGQERKVTLNVYISPSICQSPTQYRVFNDGKVTLTNLTKSSSLFFGFGLQLLKSLDKNWLIGGDLGFASKGYFATRDTIYNIGSLSGTGFTRTDLNFLETTVFMEKQIILKNPVYRIMFSTGLFYGLHIPNIFGFGLEANGNDIGTSLSIGIQRKRIFTKLDFKKGLIDIKNNANSSFKTNILSFKIGYSIL